MKSIAIITARGGSKRIPRKNAKEFCGKPIIAYSIIAALESGAFDTVMVSTDDEEIASIAKQYGAEVPFMRSEKTSNDFATSADVIAEVLEKYEDLGEKYDNFICLYPTAPFVKSEQLKEAMDTLESNDVDSVMTIVRFSFPPQRAFILRDGMVQYQYPENASKRSQDLEPLYHDCGQFYACKTDAFKQYHSLVMPRTMPIEVPEEQEQDIDTDSDWIMAELKYKMLNHLG